ncbi:MAG: aldehyde dehydrogenase family protein [Candidatus Moranbacteria bacterium]|nr:aldehyde dehydrogenase family protein [Candidatus Moranbacteria bacterium]
MSNIKTVLQKQKVFFKTNQTKDLKFRLKKIKKLKKIIQSNEKEIFKALKKDLGKSKFESYASEIGIVYEEIDLFLKNLKKWAKPKKTKTPLVHFPAKSLIYSEPFGSALIMSPWNYPFQLIINPLIGAIGAGNCAVLKPAEFSSHTSRLIQKLINQNFKPQFLYVFIGGKETNQELLAEKFDYIFFTGSPFLGRIVMEKASKNLTPVTLELGGKSPCIVEKSADLKKAAKRIAWGKFLNAGQTCTAPDYLFVQTKIKKLFIKELKTAIKQFYSKEPQKSSDFPRIINQKHWERLDNLMQKGKIAFGGQKEKKGLFISPTIIENIKPKDPIMQEEIFGPLLPVFDFSKIEEVIDFISDRPKPLALYLFTQKKSVKQKIIRETSCGGMCINETIMHVANPYLPFGGVGNSGMGRYHGKFSFDTFSNPKAVLEKSNLIDVPLRYPPYKKLNYKLVRKILG